jgi:molecular chaperone GrpE
VGNVKYCLFRNFPYNLDMTNNDAHDDVIPTDEEGVPLKKKKITSTPDEVDGVIEDDQGEDSIKKLRDKLKVAIEEKQKYLDSWQRAQAEFLNIRKRDEESKKEFLKYAKEEVLLDMIPVLDSFEMAMGNKDAWEKADKNWRMGVEFIYSQLKASLEKNGLKEENPLGQKYNPMIHEAIENVPVEDKSQEGIVISVISKGYSLNGKELRPAKVKVGEIKG